MPLTVFAHQFHIDGSDFCRPPKVIGNLFSSFNAIAPFFANTEFVDSVRHLGWRYIESYDRVAWMLYQRCRR